MMNGLAQLGTEHCFLLQNLFELFISDGYPGNYNYLSIREIIMAPKSDTEN
jgi:hypothetical protein